MGSYKIYIVVDAGSEIGMGHLSRCTAFYDKFYALGVDVEYLLDSDIDYSSFLGSRRYTCINWHADVNALSDYVSLSDFIFLDSLHISQKQADVISSLCKKLIVIDDFLRLKYENTIIIDWTPNVENTGKHRIGEGKNDYLLGAGYAVLRTPFADYNSVVKSIKNDQLTILVVMGGSDIRNLTYPIVNALMEKYPEHTIRYIDGRENPVDATTMFKLMNEADIVISAAGQTLFELLKLRKPTIPIQVIDNQQEDVDGMLHLCLYDEYYQWDDPQLIDKILSKVSFLSDIRHREESISRIKNIQFKSTPEEVIRLINECCY